MWSASSATAGARADRSTRRSETFTVTSATQITRLGSADLILPKPEQLRSVRFDGMRPARSPPSSTDPLFTIDLANPALPKQAGELEMPGWVFHMEPRGDRLIGFGYDDTGAGPARTSRCRSSTSPISPKPTMLERVSFGSAGARPPKIRIAFSVGRVLDDRGDDSRSIASYGWWDSGKCEPPRNGIQLIDFGRDHLTLRGIAPQWGLRGARSSRTVASWRCRIAT